MLPLFPQFKKLELSDREDIEKITTQFPPYSDFNFTSLWSYNVNEEAEISSLHGNLVIKFHDYITLEPFFTFIGSNKVDETIQLLFSQSEQLNISSLNLIPEDIVNKLNGSRQKYNIIEDVNSHDYVYRVDEHMFLRGRKYSDKRYLVNHFIRNHQVFEIRSLNPTDSIVQRMIMELFDSWGENKNITPHNTIYEKKAIERLLRWSHIFSPLTIGIFIDDRLAAFSMSNIVHNNFAIGHFEKVDYSHIGLSAFIRKIVAQYLYQKGCMYVNYEQDLGLNQLRESKKHWNPVAFLKKYKISML